MIVEKYKSRAKRHLAYLIYCIMSAVSGTSRNEVLVHVYIAGWLSMQIIDVIILKLNRDIPLELHKSLIRACSVVEMIQQRIKVEAAVEKAPKLVILRYS